MLADAAARGVVERTQLGAVQRGAVALQDEVRRAANLLGHRAACQRSARCARAEAHAAAPQREREREREHKQRRCAVVPHQRQQRRSILGRHEPDFAARLDAERSDDGECMVALKDRVVVEDAGGGEHGDLAAPDTHPQEAMALCGLQRPQHRCIGAQRMPFGAADAVLAAGIEGRRDGIGLDQVAAAAFGELAHAARRKDRTRWRRRCALRLRARRRRHRRADMAYRYPRQQLVVGEHEIVDDEMAAGFDPLAQCLLAAREHVPVPRAQQQRRAGRRQLLQVLRCDDLGAELADDLLERVLPIVRRFAARWHLHLFIDPLGVGDEPGDRAGERDERQRVEHMLARDLHAATGSVCAGNCTSKSSHSASTLAPSRGCAP